MKIYELIEEHYKDGKWHWASGTCIYYKKKENIKKACESANNLEKDENKIWSYTTIKTED